MSSSQSAESYTFAKNKFYIYGIFCPLTGVAKYYGKGQGTRWQDHWCALSKTHLSHWIRKLWREHGLQPVVHVTPCRDEDMAFSLEIWFIHKYGRKNLGTGTLYNLTNGGEGAAGLVFSAEARAKVAAAGKGRVASAEAKANIAAALKGQVRSAETRAKMSAAALRRPPFSDGTRAKLAAASKGCTGAVWATPVTCPHCAKFSTNKMVMTRWHFDNCRSIKTQTSDASRP